MRDGYAPRANRLIDTRIPDILWIVPFPGAPIHVALLALFDMERPAHLVPGAALAIFPGAAVFLVAALADPFSGATTIGPEAFERARTWMRR